MDWDCHVLRDGTDGQVASVHPRSELDPFSCLDRLRLGEAVSAVLLASTVWGLASQALLHEGEVLVRVGWQSPNAEPLPQSAR